ncbi:MAG: indolepyruvate oxidoreductase subunit beta [Dehalococcoidia bacterium]|nr:indolepyruvate oxidoreductase subunit beta [Dehalococcoidia bacterium]
MKKLDMLVIGVGGQGVVLATDIIGEAALIAGYDVKKTDTLGMAQRGGSVVSHIRIGQRVCSPLIRKGDVDILVALEKLEAARWCYYLRPGGIALINNLALPPLSVNMGNERYPSDKEITDILKRQTDRIYFIDGTHRARELGNIRTLNIFMLGTASVFVRLEVHAWEDGISRRLSPNIREINITAFHNGRKEMRSVHL